MSRFFTPTGDRKKYIPMYAPPPRKRKDSGKVGTLRSGAEESDGGGLLSDDYKSDVNNPSKHLTQLDRLLDFRHFSFISRLFLFQLLIALIKTTFQLVFQNVITNTSDDLNMMLRYNIDSAVIY